MGLSPDTAGRNKKSSQERHILVETVKKLRALNADPRMVGINYRMTETGYAPILLGSRSGK